MLKANPANKLKSTKLHTHFVPLLHFTNTFPLSLTLFTIPVNPRTWNIINKMIIMIISQYDNTFIIFSVTFIIFQFSHINERNDTSSK